MAKLGGATAAAEAGAGAADVAGACADARSGTRGPATTTAPISRRDAAFILGLRFIARARPRGLEAPLP